jgi:D-alanine-D-alanine ligase
MQPSVLVLMGGPDAERAVSIMSGKQVAQALRDSGRFRVIEKIIDAPTPAEIDAMGGDVIFPVLHGRWGEGGALQRTLDDLGKPYVGSTPAAAALAMDKWATKSLLAKHGIPTPPAQVISAEERCDISPPLVIKPVDDGSSVDLRICRTQQHVDDARQELHPRRGRLLAETYIRGREITVGIVLDEPLPLIEIIPSDAVEFYDYEAKYHRDDTRYTMDPRLPDGVAERCRQIALTAWRRVGCRDVARVDIMLDERGPWFLEINTMPGFTTHSLVPMAAAHGGAPMPELCVRLVQAALARARATLTTSAAARATR